LGQATGAFARGLREVELGAGLVPAIDGGATRATSLASGSIGVVDTHPLDRGVSVPMSFGARHPGDHTVIVWAFIPKMASNGAASSPSARDLGDDAPVGSALETGEVLNGPESETETSSESSGIGSTKTSISPLSMVGERGTTMVDGMISFMRGNSPRLAVVLEGDPLDDITDN